MHYALHALMAMHLLLTALLVTMASGQRYTVYGVDPSAGATILEHPTVLPVRSACSVGL